MQVQVSIILINFNTFQLTSNCIESLLLHTKGVAFEIILVDNASSECDADLFLKHFPSVKLIKSDVNIGFSRGNNLGIKYATGQYILLLNSDTVFVENSILFIYNEANKITNLGAATIKLIYPDGTIQPAAKEFPSIIRHFLEVTRLFKIFKSKYNSLIEKYDYDSNFSCDWIWGTFFFFPKKNLTVMNGKLSDTYFMYSEDVEWCYNFKKAGLNNYYFSNSKIIHLIGKSSSNAFKNTMMKKNHLHFIRANYGLFTYIIESFLLKLDKVESAIRQSQKKSIL